MLEISPEKVSFLVLKARVFDEDMPNVDEDDPDDPTLQEMVAFINALTITERNNLVALVWLGRGTYDKAEWDGAVTCEHTALSKRVRHCDGSTKTLVRDRYS